MSSSIEKAWYKDNWLARLLIPLSWLFALIAIYRRRSEQRQAREIRLPAPVVVVGNISVGGTGKTPLLISMVEALRARGFRPGVISRGYGGKAPSYPLSVTAQTPASEGGDEPVLIAQQAGCPVVVDPNRLQAARYLLAHHDCNLLLSDDGMQHYKLPRDIEIAVIDGQRGFGNGRLLPAGPLREPETRLQETDFVVVNGAQSSTDSSLLSSRNSYTMSIVADELIRPLHGGEPVSIKEWESNRRHIHAVAGIGNPQRFANTLTELGFQVDLHAFPDHHDFTEQDLQFDDDRAVLLTAKDAVKCRQFARGDYWVLDVSAQLPEEFWQQLSSQINTVKLQ